jgi:predicted nucleic acid-binding Zn ribbon protein
VLYCPICGKDVKPGNTTCSRSCANRLFRTKQRNPNWSEDAYRSTCFAYHEKKCVVCGETKIVAVHHFNGNHNDNRPENLIPICPTHHSYVHSRYAAEVLPAITEYREQWLIEHSGQLLVEAFDVATEDY